MNLKLKRLEDYSVTQLFPINILDEDKKKKLAISLNLFKICKEFPKEEISKYKKFQKDSEKNPVSFLLFKKDFESLSELEKKEVLTLLNKRAQTPTRTSPYIKFIIKSILKTIQEDIVFSTYLEELDEGWVFSKDNVMYDLTINSKKIFGTNCLYFDSHLILDEKNLIKENFIYSLNKLPIDFNDPKIELINKSFNKVIKNYNKLYCLDNKIIDISLSSFESKLKED